MAAMDDVSAEIATAIDRVKAPAHADRLTRLRFCSVRH